MILFSHPTGNAFVRHAALALAEAGLLKAFWTCVSWPADSVLNRLLPGGIRAELARRSLPGPVRAKTRHAPGREIGRMLASKLGWNWPLRHEAGCFSVDAVYGALDRKVAHVVERSAGLSAVFAFEDGAAATFEAARRRGLRRIYELPIGYWRAGRAIFDEEALREPEWAGTLTGRMDSPAKLERKDEELRLADDVIVASAFTRNTLSLAPQAPANIHFIPYASPSPVAMPPAPPSGGSLKVIFVGSLGQRKGLSYLLDAVRMIGSKVELTLIGRKPSDACAPLNEAVKLHRWIPSLPHTEVLREMGRHDVLVFPSLFEGFGLVILEAMAQGVPVITTAHTAGPDIITDGVDGFIVPIRSPEAIAEKLDLLAADPRRLAAMREAAIETARRCSWADYQRRLVEVVAPLVSL